MTNEENVTENLPVEESESEKSTTRTSELLYSQDDVQQIIFLSMLTGMQFRDVTIEQGIKSVNLDGLIKALYDNVKTVEDVKALLSQPVVAVGFVYENTCTNDPSVAKDTQ